MIGASRKAFAEAVKVHEDAFNIYQHAIVSLNRGELDETAFNKAEAIMTEANNAFQNALDRKAKWREVYL